PGEERDLAALDRAAHDHVGLAAVEDPLGRDELDLQGHQEPADLSPSDLSPSDLSPSALSPSGFSPPSSSSAGLSERAFSRALSALPTLKNACSGRSSSSPFTSCSKESIVSWTGT